MRPASHLINNLVRPGPHWAQCNYAHVCKREIINQIWKTDLCEICVYGVSVKPGLGTEIKMNIDINFSIIEIHVLNIDINFDISKFSF